jgi:hypothetical protein
MLRVGIATMRAPVLLVDRSEASAPGELKWTATTVLRLRVRANWSACEAELAVVVHGERVTNTRQAPFEPSIAITASFP